MEQIKLIAIDLDDTLLNSKSKVSEENLIAIRQLNDYGVYFAPCSGRSLGEMPRSIVDNPDIRYIIHSNGSAVLDKQTGKTIFASISTSSLKKIFEVLEKFKAHLTIRANNDCYIQANTDTDYHVDFYDISDSHVDVIRNYAIKVENFDDWKLNAQNVSVVAAFFHDMAELEKCKEILSRQNDLLIVSAAKNNLEIISKNAGKGNGILTLAKLLNVDVKFVAGVGDSGNDLPMMKVAGIRFAVSNATDELKAVCDNILCSNNEHVVKYILENLIIKN